MKKFGFVLSAIISLFTLCGDAVCEEPADVAGVRWDAENRTLSYVLSGASRVKIRAGEEGMAVVRTLVNVEPRPEGINHEAWNGTDESGRIDFLQKISPHFCVSPVAAGAARDEILDLRFNQGSLIIDLPEAARREFMKQGADVRVFLNSNLALIDRIQTLPYTCRLTSAPAGAPFLITVNLWQKNDSPALAYGHILAPAEEVKTPPAPSAAAAAERGNMAYCRRRGLYWQVYTADIKGKRIRQVTFSPVDKCSPVFSPDGRALAYTTNTGELWLMEVSGAHSRRIPLAVTCYQPRWSPDGARIVFVSFDDVFRSVTGLWTVEIAAGKLEKAADRPFLQYYPVWTPDGESIAFIDGPELIAQEIRKFDRAAGDVVQLSDSGMFGYEMQPVFFSDGALVYASDRTGAYDIWFHERGTPAPRNLTNDPAQDSCPNPAADGRMIYYLSDRSGRRQVWRINRDGGERAQVTRDREDKRDLSVWTGV